jgi:opacity protein-like surface antigen
MRKLIVAMLVAGAALIAGSAQAADLPHYPPIIELPPVDYGLEGSFYLRGSAAGNIWWAEDGGQCGCVLDLEEVGYGYSLGVGAGYETGTGLRADVTLDFLDNRGLTSTTGHKVNLRSGLLLANVYYDFGFSDYGSAAGGFGAYVGAGIGAAYNTSEVFDAGGALFAWGDTFEGAAALMAGVTYDMGDVVADLGYRAIYMDKVMSTPPNLANAYIINQNWIHEVRGTLRYRFN